MIVAIVIAYILITVLASWFMAHLLTELHADSCPRAGRDLHTWMDHFNAAFIYGFGVILGLWPILFPICYIMMISSKRESLSSKVKEVVTAAFKKVDSGMKYLAKEITNPKENVK